MYTKNKLRRVTGVNRWRFAERVSRYCAIGFTFFALFSFGRELIYPLIVVAVERRYEVTLPATAVVATHSRTLFEKRSQASVVMNAHDLPQLIAQLKPSTNPYVLDGLGISFGKWQKTEKDKRIFACKPEGDSYMIVTVEPMRDGKVTVHFLTSD